MQIKEVSDIVRRAAGGDEMAWRELVGRFQRRIFAAALVVSGSVEEADEVTQEAFVKLMGHIETISDPEAVGAWLVRTAVNEARDRRRFRRIRAWFGAAVSPADDQASVEASPEVLAGRNEMMRLFDVWQQARLSDRERLVVQLRAGEEMTFAEIAHALSMSVSSAKTHWTRARTKLAGLRRRVGKGDADETR